MTDCPFCAHAADSAADDVVALRTPQVLVLPTTKQRKLNRGHMLVVPTAHITALTDMSPALLEELFRTVGLVCTAVRAAFGASGAFVFQNDNSPDQVLFHVHVHVIPRHPDDNLRMPDPTSEILSRDERCRQAEALRRALRETPQAVASPLP